jgi:hypothetical protein
MLMLQRQNDGSIYEPWMGWCILPNALSCLCQRWGQELEKRRRTTDHKRRGCQRKIMMMGAGVEEEATAGRGELTGREERDGDMMVVSRGFCSHSLITNARGEREKQHNPMLSLNHALPVAPDAIALKRSDPFSHDPRRRSSIGSGCSWDHRMSAKASSWCAASWR